MNMSKNKLDKSFKNMPVDLLFIPFYLWGKKKTKNNNSGLLCFYTKKFAHRIKVHKYLYHLYNGQTHDWMLQ